MKIAGAVVVAGGLIAAGVVGCGVIYERAHGDVADTKFSTVAVPFQRGDAHCVLAQHDTAHGSAVAIWCELPK